MIAVFVHNVQYIMRTRFLIIDYDLHPKLVNRNASLPNEKSQHKALCRRSQLPLQHRREYTQIVILEPATDTTQISTSDGYNVL